MGFGTAAARLRGCMRGFRATLGAVAFALALGAAAPAWSACLTSTLVLNAPPYNNTQCITPPADNDGIQATGTTYTLNNSGDITVRSTVAKALPTAAINATASGDLTVINNGALTGIATGTGQVQGIRAFETPTAATGTVTINNNGAINIDATGATAVAAAAGISASANQILFVNNTSTITLNGNANGFLLGIVGTTGSETCNGVTCTTAASNPVTNITNSGTIVVNAPNSVAISPSSVGAGSSVNNVTNLGTISVTGAGSAAINGFAQIAPLSCPIAACVFTFGPMNVSNSGQISAGPNAFLFFASFGQLNPINLITNNGTLDGQFRNPAIPAADFTQNDLTNAGLLTISYAGAGLAQIVDGHFTQTASGTLGLRVNAAGQHDFLTTGQASLGGKLLAVMQPGNYANTTVYTGVVQSTAAITTTFNSVAASSPFFAATATYHTNTVDLTLTRQQLGLLPGLTFNERAVGNALEAGLASGGASGPGARIYTALFGLQSVSQVANAYDQLSGEIHADAQSMMLEDSRYARETILARLRQLGFMGGGPMAALGAGGPALAYAETEDHALAYASARGAAFPIKAPPTPRNDADLTFWAQGVGAWGRIDSDGNAGEVRRDLAGFFAGIDRRFGDWRAGIVGGYTNSSVTVASRASSATIDTGHLGGYAGTSYGAFNLRAGADFAWNDISTSRAIVFPGFADRANASYGAGEAQIFGEVGYGMSFRAIALEPFGGLAFVHLHTNNFAEAGGIAALTGGSNAEDVGYSTLGVRAATTWLLANGMALTPRGSLAWQHAFGDVTPAAALAFQSIGTGFTVAGAPIARDAALVSAGADLQVTPRAAVGIGYTGEIAANARDNSVKGFFSWKF
jgi:outer membrane autotransporter protein